VHKAIAMKNGVYLGDLENTHNNRIHSDSKKRRSFLALLFAAGDAKR
jgi:hypothetical protein